ncbi:hypothetical protein LguiA_034611 [Lonicera macranthoides]
MKTNRLSILSDHTTPANTVAGNDDLLTEILRRLPVITLLRFKSVSKHWFSLITHPHFSPLQNPNLPCGFFLPTFYGNEKLDPDLVPFKSTFSRFIFAPRDLSSSGSIKILCSCNGLLCCGDINYRCQSNFYVYNPSNQKLAIIPRPDDIGVTNHVIGVNLAFDPSKSPQYKLISVVLISRPPYAKRVRIDIYSSDTGDWNLSVQTFSVSFTTIFSRGVYFNGAIHWISRSLSTYYFDVDQEHVQVMPMPPVSHELGYSSRKARYFGESSGHLHLIETNELGKIQFDVFEMERDCSGWFVKYCVDLSLMVNTYPKMIPDSCGYRGGLCYGFFPLYVLVGERNEDSYMVLYVPGKVVRYNLVDKTFKLLFDYDPPSNIDYFLRIHTWSGSFPFIASLSYV